MTTVSASAVTAPDHAVARRALVPAALASGVLITFFETVRSDSLAEVLSMVPLGLAATAVGYGVVVRRGLRHEGAPVRALVMAALSLLLSLTFWSGVPLVLGGAAALLGFAGRRASSRSGLSIAAFVLGVLGVLAYLGIYVGDWIAHPGIATWR